MRAVVLSLLLAACASDVSTQQAHALVAAGARLLDVRSRQEYAERHAPGAINIPVEELRARLPELEPRARPIVVYCHTGVRAGVATRMLRKAGFSAVYDLGSISSWFKEREDTPPLY